MPVSDTTLAGSSASRPSFQGIGIARATYWWFLAPATTLAVLLVILPLVALIVMTFLRWNLTESPIPAFAGVDNYLRLFADGAFWASVGRTLVFTAESIILQLALGIAIAVLFNRDWFGMGVQWQPASASASGLDIQVFRGLIDAATQKSQIKPMPQPQKLAVAV